MCPVPACRQTGGQACLPQAGRRASKEHEMEKLTSREHDFGAKLRQRSVVQRLREYVTWQRRLKADPGVPPASFGPLSVNLDLTLACNFACPHCVDSTILNDGNALSLEDVKKTIRTLHSKGLLSVILLGGGEPTLHRDFEKVVQEIKGKRLQIGIVTNGSRMDRVAKVAEILEDKDWVRISIDAGREETFQALHRPRTGITLRRILASAKKVKEKNPKVSLGYSFVIVWEGLEVHGSPLRPNMAEMAGSVRLAQEQSFDYVSFKPCLVRLDSQRESLLDHVDPEKEKRIVDEIRTNLEKARTVARDRIRILESVNLKAMLNAETGQIKKQPRRCHMQFFRTVVTPSGIFHCPAFRGVERAKIGESDGYVSDVTFGESLARTATSLLTFNAERECQVVGCFYHHTNWWLENLIESDKDIESILNVEDDNFFL